MTENSIKKCCDKRWKMGDKVVITYGWNRIA